MKAEGHPALNNVCFLDIGTGRRFLTKSTMKSARKEQIDGVEYFVVARDVTMAWVQVKTGYQRVDLTNQLVVQARDALDLAQQRYDMGLSSIVELTQAQLNETEAEIAQASARYEYQEQTSALKFQTGQLR